ncbi:hypothetical protein OJ963_40355 [Streptomyces sp. RS2]|uniref:hypothetical protein n=1 Tax=Streptomyces sp. RS2 TaxID=1451205 RepID=UPI0021F8D5B4|nr:hypothetical protein [Streptomyces sp. RS2]MCW1100046.1 hypothetical protein [Streptomyces sp. RS2]
MATEGAEGLPGVMGGQVGAQPVSCRRAQHQDGVVAGGGGDRQESTGEQFGEVGELSFGDGLVA